MNRSFKLKNNSILLMLSGLIFGLLFFTFHIVGLNFEYFPGDLGDARLNLYFLEHNFKFFTGNIPSYWDATFMYPQPNVIAYSDNLSGSAPIYSLFRLLGFDIYLSYQLWIVVVSALNYISAFYLLKYLFKDNYAAVLGAVVFAFSIALQSQMAHAQTFPRFAIPLALYMVVRFREDLNPKYFFYTLFFVVYQIYCGIYLGFMLAVPIAIFLILMILPDIIHAKRRFGNFKSYAAIVGSVAVNVALLFPLMLPYMERKIVPNIEHFKMISHSLPTVQSHLFSPQGSFLWDFLTETGMDHKAWWNHQIFVGGIATICFLSSVCISISVLVSARFRLSKVPTSQILLFTGMITFLLYLRFGDTSAYLALYYLPGFSSMRSLARIINIELIFFAISTTYIFTNILKHYSQYRFLIFLSASILIIVDNYIDNDEIYKTEVSLAKSGTDRMESTFASISPGSVVSYEPVEVTSENSFHYHIDAMLLSQKYGLKTLNAYTATCPGDYGRYWACPDADSRNLWLRGRYFSEDTLYVISRPDVVGKIYGEELQSIIGTPNSQLEQVIDYIRSDKKWMIQIEKKARERQIPIDSMLILDAQWMIDHGE